MGITLSFTLMLPLTHSYGFHENLGIDDNKASQLYQENPNDPAILQWKNALQLAISGMDKCFDIETATLCVELIPTIISNCVSHPNTLLACNDSRFPQYPTILKQAVEAKKQAEEAKSNYSSKLKNRAANVTIDRCNISSNTSSDGFCDTQLRSLQRDCQITFSKYNYCKDERFVSSLKLHNIPNSTVSL